jgi:RNA polymerase sigma-70 factor, ECF subfamily
MSATDVKQSRAEIDPITPAASARDESTFSELVERHRRELHAHCYRMLGSFEDAEDLVQETFLRAWRWRRSVRDPSSRRAWLYRIATNACLDALQRRSRSPRPAEGAEVARLRERMLATDPQPDTAIVSKETTELAFTAAIEHLPSKQRAALILRGVFGLSAKDSASLLEASVVSVNSALQRARRTLRDRLPDHLLEWPARSDPREEDRALVRRYLEAIERADANAFVRMIPREPAPRSLRSPGSRRGRPTLGAAPAATGCS